MSVVGIHHASPGGEGPELTGTSASSSASVRSGRRKWWFATIAGGVVSLAMVGVSLLHHDLYRAESRIAISPATSEFGSTIHTRTVESADSFVDQQIKIIRSPETLALALGELPEGVWRKPDEDESTAVTRLGQAVKVARVGSGLLISVSATTEGKNDAAHIVDAVTGAYLRCSKRDASARAGLALLEVNRDRLQHLLRIDEAQLDRLSANSASTPESSPRVEAIRFDPVDALRREIAQSQALLAQTNENLAAAQLKTTAPAHLASVVTVSPVQGITRRSTQLRLALPLFMLTEFLTLLFSKKRLPATVTQSIDPADEADASPRHRVTRTASGIPDELRDRLNAMFPPEEGVATHRRAAPQRYAFAGARSQRNIRPTVGHRESHAQAAPPEDSLGASPRPAAAVAPRWSEQAVVKAVEPSEEGKWNDPAPAVSVPPAGSRQPRQFVPLEPGYAFAPQRGDDARFAVHSFLEVLDDVEELPQPVATPTEKTDAAVSASEVPVPEVPVPPVAVTETLSAAADESLVDQAEESDEPELLHAEILLAEPAPEAVEVPAVEEVAPAALDANESIPSLSLFPSLVPSRRLEAAPAEVALDRPVSETVVKKSRHPFLVPIMSPLPMEPARMEVLPASFDFSDRKPLRVNDLSEIDSSEPATEELGLAALEPEETSESKPAPAELPLAVATNGLALQVQKVVAPPVLVQPMLDLAQLSQRSDRLTDMVRHELSSSAVPVRAELSAAEASAAELPTAEPPRVEGSFPKKGFKRWASHDEVDATVLPVSGSAASEPLSWSEGLEFPVPALAADQAIASAHPENTIGNWPGNSATQQEDPFLSLRRSWKLLNHFDRTADVETAEEAHVS